MNLSLRNATPPQPILKPKVVFSYGMTKSGSTLAFEIARTGLERAGFAQPRLSSDVLGMDHKINFASRLTPERVEELWEEVSTIGHPIVIKTHSRPDGAIIDLINRGDASVIASFRDPREIALSMLDHGVRSRERGIKSFSEYTDLDSTIPNIRSQIDTLTQWLYRPNCLPVYYHDLAFRRTNTARWIMAHLGLSGPVGPVIDYVDRNRFTQRNLAKPKRFQQEMNRQESRLFKSEFALLFKELISKRDALMGRPGPVLPETTVLI